MKRAVTSDNKLTLARLAEQFGAKVSGDPSFEIHGICTLEPGDPHCLGFLADQRYLEALKRSRAGALVLSAEVAADYRGNALISSEPALIFARIATLFDDTYACPPGRHSAAVVEAGATVADSAWIGANTLIEAGACVGERCFIGSGCVIRRNAVIGDDCRLEALIYIGSRCELGARVHVSPGAVIGARGFGLARSEEGWEEMPQVGAVRIGDDVEVGANTCIDRGTLDDTIIGNGVKLDNHIQIAHNCRIGSHTAVAACAGIAGSTEIGKRCMIGGAAKVSGHLRIADDVVIFGDAMVTKSILEAGTYGSGIPAMKAHDWRRMVGRLRRLAGFESRIQKMERRLKIAPDPKEVSGE